MIREIIIRTDDGPVRLSPNSPETVVLHGNQQAITKLQEVAPILELSNIPFDAIGDVINRLVMLSAVNWTPDKNVSRILEGHESLQKRTFTENPLVLFQTIDHDVEESKKAINRIIENNDSESDMKSARLALDHLEGVTWKTERVFLDQGEAERFVYNQAHRYDHQDQGKTWRFYTGIAEGALKQVAKEARELAQPPVF